MLADRFIEKWQGSTLTERSAAHSHFIDLCRLLEVETPTEADRHGEWYCFERGALKTAGRSGWADVWKRGHFGWEYKGKKKDLTAAFVQLQQYAVALENPPLLVVSDMDRIVVHTNWTNTVSETRTIALEHLRDPYRREQLRCVFTDPERLKPLKSVGALTKEAADKFAGLAIALRGRGHDPGLVAHFVNRLVFCMFAEDIDLLPRQMFSRVVDAAFGEPDSAQELLADLFQVMRKGGRLGIEKVEWFNGGLFDDATALPLTRAELKVVGEAARLDWSDIDPSIFGTLFERGLDPAKRSQLGAHYTDPDKIMMIVRPVIVEPLEREWAAVLGQIDLAVADIEQAKLAILNVRTIAGEEYRQSPTIAKEGEKRRRGKLKSLRAQETEAVTRALSHRDLFLKRLRDFRVLDPACGSGNFLYLALQQLKNLEHRVWLECEARGMLRGAIQVGPEAVKGIEINPYAAELARVTVWIGEIQWMRKNGFSVSRQPILKPLDTIECRDALLNEDGTEAAWPEADVIVGNPPFLGDRRMIRSLGEDYVEQLRKIFGHRIPGSSDLVCYWFLKAQKKLTSTSTCRFGLVSTNNIRSGSNRKVLDEITSTRRIFSAWQDESWTVDGAAVRVSIVCVTTGDESIYLNGKAVLSIHADLTAAAISISAAKVLNSNKARSFVGVQKNGPFEIKGQQARDWLKLPRNPNGKFNSDVLRPTINGGSAVGIDPDRWLIDFGTRMTEEAASLYETPFQHVLDEVKPKRMNVRRKWHKNFWWLHGDPRPGLRVHLKNIDKYLLTPMVSKYRLFVFVNSLILPENKSIAFVRNDFMFFGVMHSRFHELWSLNLCSYIGVGNDPSYSPSRCFETFPFPEGLTPDIPAADYAADPRAIAIAAAAKRLDDLRNAWLNPPDLVTRVPEVVPGYPDRILPVDAKAAAELKKRTLTNLYNQRPAWLANAHRALDEAVAAAYGWPAGLGDDDILARLLALNLERTAAGR